MKKIFYLWIILFVYSIPLPCYASYAIELKNGTKFITNQYWEEGGQVKFYLYGGVAGFSKNLVVSIKESNAPYADEQPKVVLEENKAKTTEEAKPIPGKGVGENNNETRKINDAQTEEFLEKKDVILNAIENARSAFNEAKGKNNKKELKIQRKRLLTLNGDIQALFNEVKSANGGEPPDWWPTLWPEPIDNKSP